MWHEPLQGSRMDIVVRTCGPEDMPSFFATLHASFSDRRDPDDKHQDRWKHYLKPERCHCAYDGDSPVGTAAAYEFTMTIPGGELPTAGVTMVGVLASHRRRGILRQLMRTQLSDIHERGEPLAILWASEGHIYQRFGYGLASTLYKMDIHRGRTAFRAAVEPEGRYRMVEPDQAPKVLADTYERVRAVTPGMTARTEEWWRWHLLYVRPEEKGEGPTFIGTWEQDGRVEAYAIYRVKQEWAEEGPAGKLEVMELIATSPDAARRMWSYVFGVDLVERIWSWFVPADTPLILMLQEPRRPRLTLHDGLFLRVLDVERALSERSYAADGDLVLQIDDSFCEWVAGRYRITASGGRAEVVRTNDEPDITMTAEDLGVIYLGGFPMSRLAHAGRISSRDPKAVVRADAMFATDRAPYNPEVF